MIERYFHEEEGYNPFLIRQQWQVAQLNYLSGHGFGEITRVEIHRHTDEAFVLFKGRAVLIAADLRSGNMAFECKRMRPGVTYNIPAGMWHTIAMDAEAEIIIVEKAETHRLDCAYQPLDLLQQTHLCTAIQHELA